MLEEPSPPYYFRLLAAAITGLKALGVPLLSFDPEKLLNIARNRSGLSAADLGLVEQEALLRLCRSVEEDGELHPIGQLGVREILIDALVNRMLWNHQHTIAPEMLHTPFRQPCLVIGLPRSGTTLLHRLLSLAEDARPLQAWEVQHPIKPIRGADRRRNTVRKQLQNLYTMVPSLAIKHLTNAEDAEEDFWLLNASLLSATFFIFAPLRTYETWWREQDMFPPYQLWAEMLSFFQYETLDKRLVLKAPIHTGFINEIQNAVPNITFVQIHRDPTQVVGSLGSLFHTFQIAVSDKRDPTELGLITLDRVQLLAEKNIEARKSFNGHIIDILYVDLIADPVKVIAGIHEEMGLPFTSSHRQHIDSYMSKQPQSGHGRHSYSLSELGLDNEQVEVAMDEYRNEFLAK